MEIRITFLGGQLDKRQAFTDRLDPYQIFIHPREKIAMVYFRENETNYAYDPAMSLHKTQQFEQTVAELNDLHRTDPPAPIRFAEEVP